MDDNALEHLLREVQAELPSVLDDVSGPQDAPVASVGRRDLELLAWIDDQTLEIEQLAGSAHLDRLLPLVVSLRAEIDREVERVLRACYKTKSCDDVRLACRVLPFPVRSMR